MGGRERQTSWRGTRNNCHVLRYSRVRHSFGVWSCHHRRTCRDSSDNATKWTAADWLPNPDVSFVERRPLTYDLVRHGAAWSFFTTAVHAHTWAPGSPPSESRHPFRSVVAKPESWLKARCSEDEELQEIKEYHPASGLEECTMLKAVSTFSECLCLSSHPFSARLL